MADGTQETFLHADGAAAWDMSDEGITCIREYVKPGDHTLETGAGASTLAFLEQGANHICVTPVEGEVQALLVEADRRGLPSDKLTPRIGFSQHVLPGLTPSSPLDFVLIDGGHGFPIPAIDWVYTAPMLKVGGIMMVDDVDLWTGQMLLDFMKAETCWDHIETLRGRTAVFRLVAPFELHEWTRQPHVVAKSKWSQRSRKAKNLAGLVAKGDLSSIKAKMANEKRLAEAAKDDY